MEVVLKCQGVEFPVVVVRCHARLVGYIRMSRSRTAYNQHSDDIALDDNDKDRTGSDHGAHPS